VLDDPTQDGFLSHVASWTALGTLDFDITYRSARGAPGFSMALIGGYEMEFSRDAHCGPAPYRNTMCDQGMGGAMLSFAAGVEF
jgi:hypothetical protein